MRKISICIPTFNRFQMTIDSFAQVLGDDRVSEICISDDCSTDASCQNLVAYFEGNEKVKVYRNKKNLDCYRNKAVSVSYATNSFVILLDSDNTIDTSYIDAIYAIKGWDKDTIYLPEFAKPHFSAQQWSGLTITKENVAQYVDTNLMTNLNACNMFFNKDEYLKIWDTDTNPRTSDSLYVSFLWLKAGNKILITPGLHYEHYISPNNDGHYQTFSHLTVDFHKSLMDRIKQLR